MQKVLAGTHNSQSLKGPSSNPVIARLGKLRPREARPFAQGHTVSQLATGRRLAPGPLSLCRPPFPTWHLPQQACSCSCKLAGRGSPLPLVSFCRPGPHPAPPSASLVAGTFHWPPVTLHIPQGLGRCPLFPGQLPTIANPGQAS